MTDRAIDPEADAGRLDVSARRRAALVAIAMGAMALGALVEDALISVALLAAGGAFCGIALLNYLLTRRLPEETGIGVAAAASVVDHDPVPCFLADAEGGVSYQNRAAIEKYGEKTGATLVAILSGGLASPSAVLFRLQNRAAAKGWGKEEISQRRGQMRITVHRMGEERFLWRLEELAERGQARVGDGISLPMMTVSRAGTVLFMNEAMKRLIGGREGALDRIVNDLPIRSGDIHEVAAIDGPVRARVIQLDGAAARKELYFAPLIGSGDGHEWGLFDALPVPLIKMSPDGVIQQSNRLARSLLGAEALDSLHFSDLVNGPGRPVAEWLADAAEGRAGQFRSEVVRATRAPVEVFLQVTLARIESDESVALIAVLHDATELKTLEAQFVQSQKMQAIGQLAGGVAHDFNNLLTAISGHCDLLLLKRDPGHPDYADLEQINQNANRAASLVSQLLAFSRKQNLQPQHLDLRDTLSDLAHLLNRLVGEKITLTLRHDPALKMVRADKRQLEQVLMNLVVNARDAMPNGGRIEVTTEMQSLSAPLRRERAEVPPGEFVVVKVTDEGVGISSDKLPKIFEPFFTTKKTGEGTGLGLSTAYGIIKQTGGFIFADSTPGEGTTFTIFLPAHERPAPEPAVPVKELPRGAGGRGDGVVLLVEDEAPVRAFASRALRMRGYTVLEAGSAEEALEQLEDASLDVDVFVTDVIMPGLDGPSWVSRALETRPDTRVVFVSGYAEDSFSESRARIPNSVFLPKPFSLNDLTATVQAQMN